jgi:AraC-like DNA-binding protein
MSGEIGHLQRLTNEQVAARIASYGDDGRFEASLRQLWDDAGPVIEAAARSHFGDDVGCLGREFFT